MNLRTFQIGFLLLLVACARRPEKMPTATPLDAKVAILRPVFCDAPGSPSWCHRNFFAKPISGEHSSDFYQSLYFEVESRQLVHLVSQKAIDDIFYRNKDFPTPLSVTTFQTWWPSLLQEAQDQEFAFLLIPLLYHYEERQGTELGISKPASIAFELVTIRVKDGVEVGRNGFEETQQSLSEDPLDIGKIFKRRGRWISARELTREAGQSMMNDLEKHFRS